MLRRTPAPDFLADATTPRGTMALNLSEKYGHALIAVVSIGVRAGQLGGTAAGSRPTWYLTHEYLSRDQTCDLQELQVAPLTVPLFLKGRIALGRVWREVQGDLAVLPAARARRGTILNDSPGPTRDNGPLPLINQVPGSSISLPSAATRSVCHSLRATRCGVTRQPS